MCWKQERTNISNPFQKEIDMVSAFCSYLAALCITQSSTPAWNSGGVSEHVCEHFFQHPSVPIQPPPNSLTCLQTEPVSLWSGSESTLLFCSLEVCCSLGWGGCLQTPRLNQNTQPLKAKSQNLSGLIHTRMGTVPPRTCLLIKLKYGGKKIDFLQYAWLVQIRVLP